MEALIAGRVALVDPVLGDCRARGGGGPGEHEIGSGCRDARAQQSRWLCGGDSPAPPPVVWGEVDRGDFLHGDWVPDDDAVLAPFRDVQAIVQLVQAQCRVVVAGVAGRDTGLEVHVGEAGVVLEDAEVGFGIVRVHFDLPANRGGRVRGVNRERGRLEDLDDAVVGASALGAYHPERAVRGDYNVERKVRRGLPVGRVRARGHVPRARHPRQRVGLQHALGLVGDVGRRPSGVHRDGVVLPIGLVGQRDVASYRLVGDVDQVQLR